MSKTYYCASCPEGAKPQPAEMTEVFDWNAGHPTNWDDKLGQSVPNPGYIEHAFLDLAGSSSAYLREELELEGSDTTGDGLAWPLAEVKARIVAWREAAVPEMGEASDAYVDRLEALVDLGMRHGGTHLVML